MGERCWVGNGTLLRIRRAVGFPGDVPDNALGNRGRWILAGPRWPDLVLDILPQNSYADFCFIKHVARSSPEGVVGFSNGLVRHGAEQPAGLAVARHGEIGVPWPKSFSHVPRTHNRRPRSVPP